jgi:RNA recognition motif-containing protein
MSSKPLPAASGPKKRKRDPSPDSTDTSSSSKVEPTEDVPLLSHAAKRKQKKALLKLKEPVPEKSLTKKQNKEDTPLKRQNSIWVGNLSYKTTPESLRRFFDGVGEITRMHLPTKLGGAAAGEPARRVNRGCVLACSHPTTPLSFTYNSLPAVLRM